MQSVITAEQGIAAQFVAARAGGLALAAYPGQIPATLEAAYRIQDLALAHANAPVSGWKVGRILPPLSARFGADRLAGPIFRESVQFAGSDVLSVGRVFDGGFGAAEAEFLLHIGRAPDPRQRSYSLDEAAALVDRVHVGIEIASSPLASINELGPTVTISDFGNNNGLIIGPEIHMWRARGFADWDVTLAIDGIEAGSGKASGFPDGPIGSARFLFELMAARCIALPVGTWISSGAVSGVHKVVPGAHVTARFGHDFTMSCTIEAARSQVRNHADERSDGDG